MSREIHSKGEELLSKSNAKSDLILTGTFSIKYIFKHTHKKKKLVYFPTYLKL